jgi:hypothetical protein
VSKSNAESTRPRRQRCGRSVAQDVVSGAFLRSKRIPL